MSVLADIESLHTYAYRSAILNFMAKRKQWFNFSRNLFGLAVNTRRYASNAASSAGSVEAAKDERF